MLCLKAASSQYIVFVGIEIENGPTSDCESPSIGPSKTRPNLEIKVLQVTKAAPFLVRQTTFAWTSSESCWARQAHRIRRIVLGRYNSTPFVRLGSLVHSAEAEFALGPGIVPWVAPVIFPQVETSIVIIRVDSIQLERVWLFQLEMAGDKEVANVPLPSSPEIKTILVTWSGPPWTWLTITKRGNTSGAPGIWPPWASPRLFFALLEVYAPLLSRFPLMLLKRLEWEFYRRSIRCWKLSPEEDGNRSATRRATILSRDQKGRTFSGGMWKTQLLHSRDPTSYPFISRKL